jgi:hypothetical protein
MSQNFNRYSYALNNPLKYTDLDGEFLTWSIGRYGFSIGLNFTPIGIPLGFGINVGWSDGGSAGFYGEVGWRVGGTGFGAGATLSQNFTYNFGGGGSWTTNTSVNVYASYGLCNFAASVSYTYGLDKFDWGVNAGINFGGNDAWGIGLNVGYGSSGWTYGVGGYYNPRAWQDNPTYEPDKWNDGGNYYCDEYGNIVDFDLTKQLTNNCYSYALDDIDNGNLWGLQPGSEGGQPIRTAADVTLGYVTNAAISDGQIKKPTFLNKLGFGKRGYYSVYLVSDDGVDYHWYRQDKGGNWSHKPGITPVTNIDKSGHFITNPVNANHGNYNSGGRLLWARRR